MQLREKPCGAARLCAERAVRWHSFPLGRDQKAVLAAWLSSPPLGTARTSRRASPEPVSAHLGQKDARGRSRAALLASRGVGASLRGHLLLLAARAGIISHRYGRSPGGPPSGGCGGEGLGGKGCVAVAERKQGSLELLKKELFPSWRSSSAVCGQQVIQARILNELSLKIGQ